MRASAPTPTRRPAASGCHTCAAARLKKVVDVHSATAGGTMPSIEVYRVRIEPDDVERLLEIRAAAVSEFREQVPELLRAELVRLDEHVWLDILTWSEEVDADRLGAAAQCTPASAE